MFNLKITCLVDTGSNLNILGSEGLYLLEKYNLKVSYPSDYLRVTTADGTPQENQGLVYLPIVFNNKETLLKCLIIPSIQHALILGIEFCQAAGLSLNFSNNSWQVATVNNSVVRTAVSSAVDALQSSDELTPGQQALLQEKITLFQELSQKKLGRTTLIEHKIVTTDEKPFRHKQYPLSPALQKILVQEVDEMLETGVIRPSTSPYRSPMLLVRKKDGTYRACFDGRTLNKVTVRDAYPLPSIDSIISKIRDAHFLSTIDIKKAFYNIPLSEDSRAKTAFAVPGKGLFEHCVMAFGLTNAPATMSRLMDIVLDESVSQYVFNYLDDIIVVTPTFELHLEMLQKLYERLKYAGLAVNAQKCQFCRSSLKFLGYIVDRQGIRPSGELIEAVVNLSIPKTTTHVRRLLGLINFNRSFLPDCSRYTVPISDLLKSKKKGQPITWTPEADEAFSEIKRILTTAPVLATAEYDKPFIVETDASQNAVAGVISQMKGNVRHPIAYASRTLSKAERKYTVTEKELLAVLFALQKFRAYIEGTTFEVYTDHASLAWLHNLKDPVGRLARWAIKISQFDMIIKHRPASKMVFPDYLSRDVPGLNVLGVQELKPDGWYNGLAEKVITLPERYPDFKVVNNILYKHIKSDNPVISNTSEWKLVVPTANRREIFESMHSDPLAAHFGVSKTLSRISDLYYWPKMRQDIVRYVRNCRICAAHKVCNAGRYGLMGNYKEINFPMQLLSIDWLGPLPLSKKRNQYLLVCVDWFTKYVFLFPCTKATTANAIKFLENNIFLTFGVPQLLLSDNGRQFTSQSFKDFLAKYKVQKHWLNARYHPQINNSERVNRVVITAISSYLHGNHREWDENLNKIQQAIRLACHDSTGYSPAFLMFARQVPITGDFYGEIPPNNDHSLTIGEKFARISDSQKLPELYGEVRNKMKLAYEKNKKYYNLRKRQIVYKVGDPIWKRNYTLSNAAAYYSAKLAPKYIPCVVSKIVSNLVYELQDLDGKILGNWHVKDLKPDLCSEGFSDHEEDETS